MIKNITFDSHFRVELKIHSIKEAERIQFESYCRANYYQLIWIKEGSAVFDIDLKDVNLSSDQYIFIGKDMVYKLDGNSEYSGLIVCFTDFYFDRSEQDIRFLQNTRIFNQLTPVSAEKIMHGSDLLNIEYMLKKHNDLSDPLRDDVIHTLLKLYLYRTEAALPHKDKNTSVLDTNQVNVRKFKELVNEHFILHKELSFYTEQLGISSKQLLYSTKQVLGKNAKEIIIEKTIIEAKRFLIYSGLSVKQIAYCLGFNEPNNFSIFFHKYTGITPGNFKKSILNPGKKSK